MGSVPVGTVGTLNGGLAQLGERGVRNAKVAGSIPVPSTNIFIVLLKGVPAIPSRPY